jgi:hypothetical protein
MAKKLTENKWSGGQDEVIAHSSKVRSKHVTRANKKASVIMLRLFLLRVVSYPLRI